MFMVIFLLYQARSSEFVPSCIFTSLRTKGFLRLTTRVAPVPWAAVFVRDVLNPGGNGSKLFNLASQMSTLRLNAGSSSKDLFYHLVCIYFIFQLCPGFHDLYRAMKMERDQALRIGSSCSQKAC